MGISYLIDDGLLISENRVIAGTSAKKEATKVASIKRAIFEDNDHRKEVAKAIKANKVESILILGTSDKMVNEIALRLDIPPIQKIINITDISDEEEIAVATKSRREKGKHVIPVPTFEIKKDFAGYLLDPLYVLRKRDRTKNDPDTKTIVRPTFSYLGGYTISNNTLFQIANYGCTEISGFEGMTRFRVINRPEGIALEINITANIDYDVMETLNLVQRKIYDVLDYQTALNMTRIDVTVKNVMINGEVYP
ncbi:MAG: hypothetical protein WCY62_07220 [Clostridia bacterium]